MCGCELIVHSKTKKPIELRSALYKFLIDGVEVLSDIPLSGTVTDVSIHKVKNQYGYKTGYMLIIGEAG